MGGKTESSSYSEKMGGEEQEITVVGLKIIVYF